MFLEKTFGNVFGIIWLLIFILAVLGLLVWLLIKKEKVEIVEKRELIKEDYNGFSFEETEDGRFEVKKEDGSVVKTFDKLEDCRVFVDVLLLRSEIENDSNYEIVESDGFFKVRKKGSERTLRKFETEEEAENYIKEKESND